MIKTAIIGGSGYSGKELIRLLMGHKNVQIKSLFAKNSVGKKLSDVYPLFYKKSDLVFEDFRIEKLEDVDLVFIALPHGESMQFVPNIIQQKKKIIDLSGDFRFSDTSIYEQWYKVLHTANDYQNNFIYGLPELFKKSIKHAQCVANPGCYPTTAILALAPILNTDVVSLNDIIINSLSGVSGAGRKASTDLLFCEVNETVKAYKVGNHQHLPEIQTVLEKFIKKQIQLIFIPHIIPINRGIYSTIFLKPNEGFSLKMMKDIYLDFYIDQPFIRVVDDVPQIQNVTNTNYCDIYMNYIPEGNRIIVISVIDNLIKGAAGQAIQNMNLMFNLNEDEGLNGL